MWNFGGIRKGNRFLILIRIQAFDFKMSINAKFSQIIDQQKILQCFISWMPSQWGRSQSGLPLTSFKVFFLQNKHLFGSTHLLDVEISKFVTSKSFCQGHSLFCIYLHFKQQSQGDTKEEPICTNTKYESHRNMDCKYFYFKYGLQIFLF